MSSRTALGRSFNKTRLLLWILAILVAAPLNIAVSMPHPVQQQQTDDAVPMSKDWKRAYTPNFTAVSNAPAKSVRTILEQLEIFRSSLITDFLKSSDLTSDPVLVVIFSDDNSFSRFKLRDGTGKKLENVGGYFINAPDMKYIVLPRYQNTLTLNVIFHEYYHYLLRRNIPDCPPWLSEGLAEFYSTSECDPEKGENIIGRVIPGRLQQLRMDPLLPLEKILARDSAFRIIYGKDSRRSSMFYAESWLLVHYLLLDQNGAHSHKIADYLNAIKKGMSWEKAFQTSFGVTLDKMEQELRLYSMGFAFPALRIKRSPESILRDSVSEPITEVEAEYIQGDLLQRVGANEDAERMLTKLLARQPSHISAQISLAGVRYAQERYSEALDILRPIIASNPRNFRAHLDFAAASLQTDQFEDALGEYRQAAEINPQATAALIGESYAALALRMQADADEAMARLQKLEPNPRWYDARAYEGFKSGNYSTAIHDVHYYIEQAGRGADSAPYAAFLGAICYLRLQQPTEAAKLLKEVSTEIVEGSWTAIVMDFMQGKLPSKQFLARAKDVYERTEAHTYIGMMALIAGKRDEALNHLHWVKQNGSRNYFEYGMAIAELKRLEPDALKRGAENIQ
jgi:tetratricopeptide (TPR) repeat protein